jgi:hypothetical protein
MTGDEREPISSKKAAKPAPMAAETLSEHLITKNSNASKFIHQLSTRPQKDLSEEDFEAATQAIRADRALLGRVAEIAKLANLSADFRSRKAILLWAGDVISEAQPGLEAWKPGLEANSVSLVVSLAKLSGSRFAEAKDKQAADAAMQTGIAVLMGQFSWPVARILQELTTGFEISRQDAAKPKSPEKPEYLLAKLLGRASPRQLQEYATVSLFLNAEVASARGQARKSEILRQEQYDRYLAAKARGDQLAAEVEAQRETISELQVQNQELQAQLASVHSGAAHGQTNFRARYRSFLTRKLSPNVTDAIDALEGPEPYVDVGVERLKFLKSDISKEVAWLDGSSE